MNWQSREFSTITVLTIDSSKDGSSSFVQGEVLEDTMVSYSDETQVYTLQHIEHSTETESTRKIRLSLSERREALYLFADNLYIEYLKDFVGKTREVLYNLILELEALTKRSDDVKGKLTELKATLTELDGFDIESDNLGEASDIVTELNNEFDEPVNEPPEVVAALRKVNWMDMRYELGDEMFAITNKFVIAFNKFVATLTPWERLREADLVDLNKRFNDDTTVDQWDLFSEFWTYF
ncbi:PREDICTED: uncharacterized protein LOC108967794 [Bactrocera latifrons]|uniref:uncharacterized protein LOC108967794 n=1 Tax=Bactrocera latifrons TaxID=174628 RepID=UPI0008DC762B|nr:PREDICTED: uncharacterized protein LOC108967794 [Bactrocera latifrons]